MAATNPTTNFSSTNPAYTHTNPNTTYSSSTHPVTTGTTGTTTTTDAASNNNVPVERTAAGVGAGAPVGGASSPHSAAQGIKGVFAGVHGAGEALRGTFNSAVDELAGDAHGKVKNDNITVGGVNEMESGQFTTGTKNREGAIPGDHERRY